MLRTGVEVGTVSKVQKYKLRRGVQSSQARQKAQGVVRRQGQRRETVQVHGQDPLHTLEADPQTQSWPIWNRHELLVQNLSRASRWPPHSARHRVGLLVRRGEVPRSAVALRDVQVRRVRSLYSTSSPVFRDLKLQERNGCWLIYNLFVFFSFLSMLTQHIVDQRALEA